MVRARSLLRRYAGSGVRSELDRGLHELTSQKSSGRQSYERKRCTHDESAHFVVYHARQYRREGDGSLDTTRRVRGSLSKRLHADGGGSTEKFKLEHEDSLNFRKRPY